MTHNGNDNNELTVDGPRLTAHGHDSAISRRDALAAGATAAALAALPIDVLFSSGVFRTVAPRLLALPPLSASLLPGLLL